MTTHIIKEKTKGMTSKENLLNHRWIHAETVMVKLDAWNYGQFHFVSLYPFQAGDDGNGFEGPAYSRKVVSMSHSEVWMVAKTGWVGSSWRYVTDPPYDFPDLRIDGVLC